MKAYNFLRKDMTSRVEMELPWSIGETRIFTGKIKLGRAGYHSSLTPYTALYIAPWDMLCLVDIPEIGAGTIRDREEQVSQSQTLVAAVDVGRELHELACKIAEDVLSIFEGEYPGDVRPREAIATKHRWLAGLASDSELAVARDAAWEAAKDSTHVWGAWAAATAAWDAAGASSGATAATTARAAWDATQAPLSSWDASDVTAKEKYGQWINKMLLAKLSVPPEEKE